jgi:hypothetical protein
VPARGRAATGERLRCRTARRRTGPERAQIEECGGAGRPARRSWPRPRSLRTAPTARPGHLRSGPSGWNRNSLRGSLSRPPQGDRNPRGQRPEDLDNTRQDGGKRVHVHRHRPPVQPGVQHEEASARAPAVPRPPALPCDGSPTRTRPIRQSSTVLANLARGRSRLIPARLPPSSDQVSVHLPAPTRPLDDHRRSWTGSCTHADSRIVDSPCQAAPSQAV